MTSRRDFLTRSTIALGGTLLLGDAALEAFERLTHKRRFFASADIPYSGLTVVVGNREIAVHALTINGLQRAFRVRVDHKAPHGHAYIAAHPDLTGADHLTLVTSNRPTNSTAVFGR